MPPGGALAPASKFASCYPCVSSWLGVARTRSPRAKLSRPATGTASLYGYLAGTGVVAVPAAGPLPVGRGDGVRARRGL
jgi:hypothetical protein